MKFGSPDQGFLFEIKIQATAKTKTAKTINQIKPFIFISLILVLNLNPL